MMRISVAFIATAMIFCVLDAIWLGYIAIDFYREQLGVLLRAQPDWIAAALFYVLYLCGVQMFVVLPAVAEQSPKRAAWRGALFGLFTYMTYDLTNQATLQGWSWSIVAVDIAWGMLVTAVAALAGCALLLRFDRWRDCIGVSRRAGSG